MSGFVRESGVSGFVRENMGSGAEPQIQNAVRFGREGDGACEASHSRSCLLPLSLLKEARGSAHGVSFCVRRRRLRLKYAASILLALFFILPAKAEWLYWTVDFSDTSAVESPWTDPNVAPSVWLVASTDPLTSEGGTVLSDIGGNASVTMANGNQLGGIDITDLQAYSSSAYTFFIEMGAVAGQADYRSTGYNYNDLVSAGFVKSGWTAMDGFWNASLAPWTPTHAVPEPTSGVMVVLGAALLALRRRRSDQWGSDVLVW